jgi:hypothetical protein
MIGWTAPEGAHVAFADPGLRVPIGANLQIAEARHRARAAAVLGIVLLLGAAISLRRGRRSSHSFLPMAAALAVAIPLSLSLGRGADVGAVERSGERVIDTPPGQIAAITLASGDETLSARRSGTTWRDAEEGVLSSAALDLFARLLTEHRRHAEQPAPGGSGLEALGLDPAQVRVTVADREGGEVSLRLGEVAPQSHRRAWAMIEGEETVFLVEDDLLTVARRPAARWREGDQP